MFVVGIRKLRYVFMNNSYHNISCFVTGLVLEALNVDNFENIILTSTKVCMVACIIVLYFKSNYLCHVCKVNTLKERKR